MSLEHWPLYGLRLTTPRLELSLPTLEQLNELAQRAAEGIHNPQFMPFRVEWTDVSPEQRARAVLQYHWRLLGEWVPSNWSLQFVVSKRRLGKDTNKPIVIGVQELMGKQFNITGEVSTGSWLGMAYQGHGYGTEMRAAVLHLAFIGLGAEYASSKAFTDNSRSLGVSTKLGYQPNGIERHVSRGKLAELQRLQLSRQDWETHRQTDVAITGLEPCLELFGLTPHQ